MSPRRGRLYSIPEPPAVSHGMGLVAPGVADGQVRKEAPMGKLMRVVRRVLSDRGFLVVALLSVIHMILALGHIRDSGRADLDLASFADAELLAMKQPA